MRTRVSARILLLDQSDCVLLFKFDHTTGPLAGQVYWATPGGAVEDGETLQQAALRELQEETGLSLDHIGAEIGRRSFELKLYDGEIVWAEEHFFVARIERGTISDSDWTEIEREVMVDHRWWSPDEIRRTSEIVFPENIFELLEKAPARSA